MAIDDIPDHINARPNVRGVFVAGATASGKSRLAIQIATACQGLVVNADSMQVYDCWQTLTSRPDRQDEDIAPHVLYGHICRDRPYSVGQWLDDVTHILRKNPNRLPIIVGGTGLYFQALSEGLAAIPPIDPEIRKAAQNRLKSDGLETMVRDLTRRDPETMQALDCQNPARVRRAWEVLRATGRGLRAWQKSSANPPLLPLSHVYSILLDPSIEANSRAINARVSWMAHHGALEECALSLPDWNPEWPSSKALGAHELIAFLQGRTTLELAIERITILTRQYAKRQRTWFRNRMSNWTKILSDYQ